MRMFFLSEDVIEEAIREYTRTPENRVRYYMIEEAGLLKEINQIARHLGYDVDTVMAGLQLLKGKLIISKGIERLIPRKILGREENIYGFLRNNAGIEFIYKDLEAIFYPEKERAWQIGTIKRVIRRLDREGYLARGSAMFRGRRYVTYTYVTDSAARTPRGSKKAVISFLMNNMGMLVSSEQLSRWLDVSVGTVYRAISQIRDSIYKERRGRRLRYTYATKTFETEYAYGIPIYQYRLQWHGTFTIRNVESGEEKTFKFYDAESPVGWSYDFDTDRTGFNCIYDNVEYMDDEFSPLVYKLLNSERMTAENILGLNIPVLSFFDGTMSLLEVCQVILGYTNWEVIELGDVGMGVEDFDLRDRVMRAQLAEKELDEGVFALLMTRDEIRRQEWLDEDNIRSRLSGGKSIYESILIPFKHDRGELLPYMFMHGLRGD